MTQSQFFMMGGQFVRTDGQPLKLLEIDFHINPDTVPTVDRKGAYQAVAQQVRIAFADREGSTTYYYVKNASGQEGWARNGSVLEDATVDAGSGFWYCNCAEEKPELTVSGQVLTESPWTMTFDASMRMLVNPFPVSWTLADVQIEGLTENVPTVDRKGEYQATAFQIRVPYADREGFTTYYYVKNASGAEGWARNGSVLVNPEDVVVPSGRGCWFKAPQETDVTFTLK